jgi:tetratricopeptide (TPR) repeat protein
MANKFAKWEGRGRKNSIEPECWPHIAPKFTITPGAKIFTVGSCFARNIEAYLDRAGFNLPTLIQGNPSIDSQFLNKYSPPSIFQEFKWAHDILCRNDLVTESDVEGLLYKRSDGHVIDLHLLPFDPTTYESALERRKAVYRVFKEAFTCNYVLITLGLVEAWIDTASELYVLLMPQFLRSEADLKRFKFERLNFTKAHAFITRTISLLDSIGPEKKYLITTSPVPLGRTFTQDDVIIANTYSKALLRAVAGQIAEEHEHVDYFPSFESVMLTRQSYVWEKDLIHVSPSFVDRIMARVLRSYLPAETDAKTDYAVEERIKILDHLLSSSDYKAAERLYQEIEALPGVALQIDFQRAAAYLNLRLERFDLARSYAAQIVKTMSEPLQALIPILVYRKSGDISRAEELLWTFVDMARVFPHWVGIAADKLDELGDHVDAIRVTEIAQQRGIANIFALVGLARRYVAEGDFEKAIGALRSAVGLDSKDAQVHFQLGRALLDSGNPKEAVASFNKSLSLEPHNTGRRFFLAGALERSGRPSEAEVELRDIVACEPDEARPLLMLGRFLERQRRPNEAKECFERAAILPQK